jgi:hypothetical protein
MAKARANTATEKPRSPLWVLQLIDSLGPEEIDAQVDRLARYPEGMRGLLRLALRALKLERCKVRVAELGEFITRAEWCEKYVTDMAAALDGLDQARKKVGEDEVRLASSKRKMTQARIATAEAYLKLKEENTKQITVLRALVNLPGERRKRYAVNYFESQDVEALRQYVKNLLRQYRRYEKQLAIAKVWEATRTSRTGWRSAEVRAIRDEGAE